MKISEKELKVLSPLIDVSVPMVTNNPDIKVLSPLILVGKKESVAKKNEEVKVSDARLILTKPGPSFYLLNGFIILVLTSILAVLSYMMFSTSIRDEQFFINLVIAPIFFYFLYDRIKLVYSASLYNPKNNDVKKDKDKPKRKKKEKKKKKRPKKKVVKKEKRSKKKKQEIK